MTIYDSISKIVFTRLVATACVATQLASGAVLLTCVGTAHARSNSGNHGDGGSSKPSSHIVETKAPIGHPIVISKPGKSMDRHKSKHERRKELARLHKLERCIEHGGCRGVVIEPIRKPLPVEAGPVKSMPIESKPIAGMPVGTPTPTQPAPAQPTPTKPVLTDPGYGAPGTSTTAGGGGGGRSTIENGGTPIKQD